MRSYAAIRYAITSASPSFRLRTSFRSIRQDRSRKLTTASGRSTSIEVGPSNVRASAAVLHNSRAPTAASACSVAVHSTSLRSGRRVDGPRGGGRSHLPLSPLLPRAEADGFLASALVFPRPGREGRLDDRSLSSPGRHRPCSRGIHRTVSGRAITGHIPGSAWDAEGEESAVRIPDNTFPPLYLS